MYYVYLLHSNKTGKWYVGHTKDLKRRFEDHNSGFNQSTKAGAPWELVYFEAYRTRSEAVVRENKLKHHGQTMRRLKERFKID